MRKIVFGLSIFLIFCSCNNQNSNTKIVAKEKIVYDMYEASEMTLLMRKMFDENKRIKKAIVSQKSIGEFPHFFEDIHTAELSNFKTHGDGFKSYTKTFLDAEKKIFNTSSQIDIKERFNNTINLCIACHQTECHGPIPKIKKLLIK